MKHIETKATHVGNWRTLLEAWRVVLHVTAGDQAGVRQLTVKLQSDPALAAGLNRRNDLHGSIY